VTAQGKSTPSLNFSMMGRRNVRFPHRSNGDQALRSSFSEVSDGETSVSKTDGNQQEVSCRVEVLLHCDDQLTTEQASDAPALSDYEKKKQTFITRTIWTFVMIAGFFSAMFSGHIYLIAIVTAVQIISFKEVIAIANVPSKDRNLRFTKSLNWYFLATTMYFLYGESVIYYFKHILLVDRILLPFATHHRFLSFMLYVFGKLLICKSCYRNTSNGHRVRLLRSHATKRPLSFPIHPVCLDSHGAVLDCRASSFHHEQHL
jgi:phosphatidate cytidylyltransferase